LIVIPIVLCLLRICYSRHQKFMAEEEAAKRAGVELNNVHGTVPYVEPTVARRPYPTDGYVDIVWGSPQPGYVFRHGAQGTGYYSEADGSFARRFRPKSESEPTYNPLAVVPEGQSDPSCPK